MLIDKLFINDLEIDTINLESMAILPDLKDQDIYVPFFLFTTMLGFDLVDEDDPEIIILEREDSQIIFKANSNIAFINGIGYVMPVKVICNSQGSPYLLPLYIFIEKLDFSANLEEGKKGKILKIFDPVTKFFYAEFNKRHSINQIHYTTLKDLNGDGISEFYVSYSDKNDIKLAAIKEADSWLIDNERLNSFVVFGMNMMYLIDRRALAIDCYINMFDNSLYIYTIQNNLLVKMNYFNVTGNFKVYKNKFNIYERLNDTANHVLKKEYQYNGEEQKFFLINKDVNFLYGKNNINRENADEVARGFYEALFLGLKDEALTYCTENLYYNGINYLIDYFNAKNPAKEVYLYTETDYENYDRSVIFIYYGNTNITEYIKPYHILRVVLIKINNNWKIYSVCNLKDKLPTKIRTNSPLNLKTVGKTIFTWHPTYYIDLHQDLNSDKYIRLLCKNEKNDYLLRQDIDSCSYIEFTNTFDGIEIYFYQSKKEKVGQFISSHAREIEIFQSSESSCDIHITLENILE